MSVEPTRLLFALVVLVAYGVQTTSGFGAMLVCVTLGAHLLPIRELVALVLPISVLQNAYIVARHRDGIRWRLLLARILPLMGTGTVVGFLAFRPVAGRWLRVGLAVLVLLLAARELWRLRAAAPLVDAPAHPPTPPRRPPTPAATPPAAASTAALVGAGIIHGVYATGGPLLVYALGREPLDKHAFRSTLAAVWLALSLVLVVGLWLDGRYGAASLRAWLLLLPVVPLGVAAGEVLHRRVPERRFRQAVFTLLVLAALALLFRAEGGQDGHV